jgi:hypothetical protein
VSKKTAPSTPKKRRRRWLPVCLVALLALVGLLPTLVSKTPLFGYILKLATSNLNGSVKVDSISLGWFSPIQLKGIEVKDAAGKPVLSTASITGDRTLAAIACNYTKLGLFRIENPTLSVVVRENGSNVEDLLANYLTSSSATASQTSSAATKIGLAVEIVDGSASVADVRLGQVWRIGKLGMKFDMSEGVDGPILADVSAEMPAAEAVPAVAAIPAAATSAQSVSKLKVGLKMTPGANEATVDIQQFPLAMLRSVLSRYMSGTTLDGQLTVSAKLQQGATATRGDAAIELAGLTLLDAQGKPQFQEPAVRLVAQGNYDPKSQTIQLGECKFTSSIVAAAAAGNIATVNGKNNAQLEAQLNYDLDRLSTLLRPLGADMHLTGHGASGLRFAGPFSLTASTAAATVRWSGADVYGFPIGQTDLRGSLVGGVLQTEAFDIAVSQGKIHLAPQLCISTNPMEFRLPKGLLVDRVQLSAAMCDSLFQYIAPALAGVSSAQGSISIELDDCRIPLSHPIDADIAGRFIIHAMTLGSSPLLHEMSAFQTHESAAQVRNETVVPFQMTKGRVYHQNLDLAFSEITIRTHGYVDLKDKTMELTAEMPVPAKWLAGNAVAMKAVGNQTVSIPLHGTLSNPQVDQAAMQDQMKQFVERAASNAATTVIEGGLNQLFAPKR